MKRDSNMLSRRDFLMRSVGLGTGALSLGVPLPGLWQRVSTAAEPRADLPILVVVELTGGNDGLNTVIPHADDVYHKSRPTLRIEPDKVLELDDRIGLHPALKELRAPLGFGRFGHRSRSRVSELEPVALPLDGDLADGCPRPRTVGGMAGPSGRRQSQSAFVPRRAAIDAAGRPGPQGRAQHTRQPGRLSPRVRRRLDRSVRFRSSR